MISLETLKEMSEPISGLPSPTVLEQYPGQSIINVRVQDVISPKPIGAGIITIEDYRKILDDRESSDHQIIQRLQYLEAFCRNIIQDDLEKYVSKTRRKI